MQSKRVDVAEVIDSADFIGLPLRISVLTFFIMLVDGFDLQTMSFVAPALVTDWGVQRSVLGPVLTASMIGMAFGSICLGWLGDRIGRKRSYVVCIAFLFIGSLSSAYAAGLWDLFVYRFITGIGLGGVTPLAATLISEWTAKKVRGLAVACVIVAVPLGGMVGAEVSQWIIPAYGWRAIFLIGAGLPWAFFALAWFLLPESPKYMSQHPAKHAALAKALNRLVKEPRYDGTEQFFVPEDSPPRDVNAPRHSWFATLLKPPYLGTTLLLWVAFSFNTMGLYSFVNWLPTVLTSTGIPLEASLRGSTLFNMGGFFGAVGGAMLIGFLGSRIVGSTLSLIGGLSTLAIGITLMTAVPISADARLYALICISGMALNGMQAFLYAVGANSYPTAIRASGVGTAQTISRGGGALVTMGGGVFFTTGLPVSAFFFIVAGIISVVVVSFFSLRTHLRSEKQNRELEAAVLRNAPTP